MPAKKSSPTAPGAYESNGVRCTLDAPFSKGSAKGSQVNLRGTFDKPRDGGDNGLPTRVTADLGGANGTPKPSGISSLGQITAGKDRKGTR
jgi:hypothetical protein